MPNRVGSSPTSQNFRRSVSDPTYTAQLEVSRSLLRAIGTETVASRLVLNKIDHVNAARRATPVEKHQDAILLSVQVASVNVVENADGLRVATAQAGLGGSCRASLVGAGLSISPMASTPM